MTDDAGPPALAVGAVMGDIDGERAWGAEIGALSMRVAELGAGVRSPVRLSVVFHVDGRVAPNTFVGVRTGRFRTKDSHLTVQAAVGPGPVEDQRAVLVALLSDAVAEAESYVRKRRIADDLLPIRALVDQLSAS
ncbi:hypothetical protein [Promicromonospora panici]|uniref:hypothetical protein n=1 Tax=Promicromonospora panici TaxID=2219658 RepID=UPI00101D896D|nr:hypothetical protein [Promicromonospora panici]